MDYSRLIKIVDGEAVCDSTFNRLLSLLNDDVYAIVSAYRRIGKDGKPLTKKENIKRNRELRSVFNAKKMGVYQLVGHWQEAPNGVDYETAKAQGLLSDTVERSYVVPKPQDMSMEDFRELIADSLTIDGLTQDCGIIHDEDGTYYFIYPDGGMDAFAKKCTLNKVAQAYSQSVLKMDVPFVFDGVKVPNGNADYMAMQNSGLMIL